MTFAKFTSAFLVLILCQHPVIAYNIETSEQINDPTIAFVSAAGSNSNNLPKKKGRKALVQQRYILEGRLSEEAIALKADLQNHPDDNSFFALGILQFLYAIESLGQDLYKFGLSNPAEVRFWPLTKNPHPELLTYDDAHKIVQSFVDNLAKSESTLGSIKNTNVKVPLRFGMLKLDLNGDGNSSEDETLWRLYASLTRNRHIDAAKAESFSIAFDYGDVHWLRGYCHLIMACCEIYLAHDSKEMFEKTAHVLFEKVDSPYPFLSRKRLVRPDDERRGLSGTNGLNLIFDGVALLHLIHWNVTEPERMKTALQHLEEVVRESRLTWSAILSETDDDREWLPNPRQKAVIPNVRVTNEMVAAWKELMTQLDQILAGKLLIAFWRGDDGRGINLRKVFLEPQTFDLVLWVQGSAASPYLEEGQTTKIDLWRQLDQAFGDNFPGFAAWFN